MSAHIKTNPNARRFSCFGLAVVCFYLSSFSMSYADDELFQLDPSRWTSSQNYIATGGQEQAPAAPTAEDQDAQAATPTVEMPPPNLAANLPLLPAANKGFDLDIHSTAKESSSLIADEQADEPQDPHLADSNWKSPVPLASQDAADDDSANAEKTLNIRMSFLPAKPQAGGRKVSGHMSALKRVHLQMRQNTPSAVAADKPKSPAEAAACAALDAMKKQQLEAIQSDRRTLSALQEAIKTLGLTKKLDFSSGNFSAASNTPENAGTAPTSVR